MAKGKDQGQSFNRITRDPLAVAGWIPSVSATWKLQVRGHIAASHKGSRSTTPLLRNPTELRRCSQHAGANVDFGDESAVDWAFLGNLKQLRALLWGQPPREFEVALDTVQHSFFAFAIGAVGGVNLAVAQPNGDCFERPALASRIQRNRHRSSSAQGGK
jgi:hypothetical protein